MVALHSSIVGATPVGSVKTAGPQATPITTAPRGTPVAVEVLHLKSDLGHLFCSIFADADAFPTHPERALETVKVEIKKLHAACEFKSIPPGRYAVSAYHDENDNDRMDSGLFGIPIEGVGASNDAKGSMGPPQFKDAQFEHGTAKQQIEIHLKY